MNKMHSVAPYLRFAVGLSLTLILGNGTRAQNQDFSKVEIKVTKVSGNI